jgi:adenosylcobinamide-GDP ribazoletransferase
VTDAVRLALGTLTVLPVRPPGTVDRRTAGSAMVLAPLVGLVLGVPAVVLLELLGWGPGHGPVLLGLLLGDRAYDVQAPPLLAAALVVALLAWLTRAIHLDGLADTADGLGSGRPREQTLEIMRRGDVGPFGVVTLLLALLVQVAALADLVAAGVGVVALVAALVVSRLALPLICSRGVPAARQDGLGAVVAGSVGRGGLLLSGGLTLVVAVVAVGLAAGVGVTVSPAPPALSPSVVLGALAVGVLALGSAGLVAVRAVRSLGGVTGDVLGAAVEAAFTTALVVLALVA